MRVFITGASGFIGRHLVPVLLAEGHQITLCLHDRNRGNKYFPNCQAVEADFSKNLHSEDWLPLLQGQDAIINLVGIINESRHASFENLHTKAPIALFQAAKMSNIQQIIQISALGADNTSLTKYHKSKKAADDFLLNLGLSGIILRPSILYGQNAKSWQFFRALSILPVIGLINGGKQIIQPLYIDDLVKAISLTLRQPPHPMKTLNVVGLQPITFATLLKRLRTQLTNSQAITFFMPAPIAKTLASLAALFGSKMVNRDTVTMLESSSQASPEPFMRQFGFKPHSLTFPHLSEPEKQFTRTYFLPGLLRLSIAITWLWTALVSAFFYPIESSLDLLAKTGLSGSFALVALYGAAALDFALGVAVFSKYKPKLTAFIQLLVITIYSLILTFTIAELWLHPFGPLLKNLPMVAAIITLYALEPDHD